MANPDNDTNTARDTDGHRWINTLNQRPDDLIGLISACCQLQIIHLDEIIASYRPEKGWKEDRER